eukprot:916144_1
MASERPVSDEKKEIVAFSKKLGINKNKIRDWVKGHWDDCLVNPGSKKKLILNVTNYNNKIIELRNELQRKRNRSNVFWGQTGTKHVQSVNLVTKDTESNGHKQAKGNKNRKRKREESKANDSSSEPSAKRRKKCDLSADGILPIGPRQYKQEECAKEVNQINAKIAEWEKEKQNPHVNIPFVQNKIKDLLNVREEKVKKIRNLQQRQAASQKNREVNKEKKIAYETHQDPNYVPHSPGRPNLEKRYENLHDVIIEIVNATASADYHKHYASFTISQTLKRIGDVKLMDEYNPAFKSQEELNTTKCDICGKWYPSIKLLKAHRVAEHYRARRQEGEDENDEDDDDLWTERERAFYASIVRIKDKRDGQYLAELPNGCVSWVVLDETNEKVKQYEEEVSEYEQANGEDKWETVTDLAAWNRCPWRPITREEAEDNQQENLDANQENINANQEDANQEDANNNTNNANNTN